MKELKSDPTPEKTDEDFPLSLPHTGILPPQRHCDTECLKILGTEAFLETCAMWICESHWIQYEWYFFQEIIRAIPAKGVPI